MKEIIKKLNAVADLVVAKDIELAGLIDQSKASIADYKGKIAKAKDQKKDLDEREAKIKNKEDAINILNKAKALDKETDKKLKEIDIQRRALDEAQSRVAKEHSEKAQNLIDREEKIISREKELEEKNASLDKIIADSIKKILKK